MSAKKSIAESILEMAAERGAEKSICPSEVARALWPEGWRAHMDEVREEAFRLRDEGRIRVMQHGEEFSGDRPRGPIRIAII